MLRELTGEASKRATPSGFGDPITPSPEGAVLFWPKRASQRRMNGVVLHLRIGGEVSDESSDTRLGITRHRKTTPRWLDINPMSTDSDGIARMLGFETIQDADEQFGFHLRHSQQP